MHITVFPLLLSVISFVSGASPPKSEVLKCAVCHSLIYEIHSAISKVDPRKKVDIGSYRIDADGNDNLSQRKYAGSELHMMELMESICEAFSDYVQARHKETDRLEAIKLVIDGSMNPRFSEYELVQDPELNKGVKYHCESIVEDFEDDLVSYFKGSSQVPLEESKEKFCLDISRICAGVKDEL